MGKGSAPKAPDPKELATAQTGTNVSTALANAGLNAVNQKTPGGNLTYKITGYNEIVDPSTGAKIRVPQYEADTTLSAAGQKLYDTGQATQQNLADLAKTQSGRIGSLISQPFTLNGLPAGGSAANVNLPSYGSYSAGPQLQTSIAPAGAIQSRLGTGDTSKDVANYQKTLFDTLDTQSGKDLGALRNTLAQQGIAVGSDAYTRAMDDFTKSRSADRTNAILQAANYGTTEQNMAAQAGGFANSAQAQRYGQNSNDASFHNSALQQILQNLNAATAGNNGIKTQTMQNEQGLQSEKTGDRNQALQEKLTQRQVPINEILALAGQGQLQQPQFSNGGMGTSIPTTDTAGLTEQNYQQLMQQYLQQQQQGNDLVGGLFGFGSSAIRLSDARAKTAIRPVGKTSTGHTLYSYRYKGSGHDEIGLVAQDVERRDPAAVLTTPSGLKLVDYGRALSEAAA